jgi:hypothetical protein
MTHYRTKRLMTYTMPLRTLITFATNIEAANTPAEDAETEEAYACCRHSIHSIATAIEGE